MSNQAKDPNWINVNLDWLVIRMGLRRSPKLEQDPDRFRKTAEEKAILKEAKSQTSCLHKQTKVASRNLTNAELINQKQLTINLHNLDKLPVFKTTYSFKVNSIEEVISILKSGTFFKKEEVKSVYFDNKPFKSY